MICLSTENINDGFDKLYIWELTTCGVWFDIVTNLRLINIVLLQFLVLPSVWVIVCYMYG